MDQIDSIVDSAFTHFEDTVNTQSTSKSMEAARAALQVVEEQSNQLAQSLVLKDEEQAWLNTMMFDDEAHGASQVLMVIARDNDTHAVKRMASVGFFGAMITVYDNNGEVYTLLVPISHASCPQRPLVRRRG